LQEQRGNFLLQVLLALTLVFAFMPFIAKKLASRDMTAKMYAAKTSVETLHNAARIYARENKDSFDCTNTGQPWVLEGTELTNTLEDYGLPKGFIATTSLGQDMSLQIVKKTIACGDDVNKITVDIVVPRGDLSQYQLAELARMIGFFARAEDDIIRVNVPVDVIYSDIVRRRETNEQIGFLTDLEMGGCDSDGTNCAYHNINDVNVLHAERGDLKRAQITMLTLLGEGLNAEGKNVILRAGTFRFSRGPNNIALNIDASNFYADHIVLQKIGNYVNPSPEWDGCDNVENHELNVSGLGNAQDLGFYKKCIIDGSGNEVQVFGSVSAGVSGQEVKSFLQVDGIFDFSGGEITDFDNFTANKIYSYPFARNVVGTEIGAGKHWGLGADYIFVPGVALIDEKIDIGNIEDVINDDNKIVAKIAPSTESSFADVDFVLPSGVEAANNFESASRLTNKFMGAIASGIRKDPAIGILGNSATCSDVFSELFDGDWNPNHDDTQYNNFSLLQNILCQYIYLTRLERRMNCVLCAADNDCLQTCTN